MKALIAGVLALGIAAPAIAENLTVKLSVKDCDGTTDRLWNIMEPWEKNTRRFYNDKVRITHLDTGGEPACCASWLVVIMVPKQVEDQPPQGPVCKLVGNSGNLGFFGVGFEKINATYDPKKGLLVTFPFEEYNPDGDGVNQRKLVGKFRVNLEKGTVTQEQ